MDPPVPAAPGPAQGVTHPQLVGSSLHIADNLFFLKVKVKVKMIVFQDDGA